MVVRYRGMAVFPGHPCRLSTMGLMRFIREFATNPSGIGAIAPSSGFLAEEVLRDLDLAHADSVLEYGPGTGALTGYLLTEVSPQCQLVAIERNSRFATELKTRFPGLTVHDGSVADVRDICDQHSIATVDCIVSGLPWAAFSPEMQKTFLDAMMTVLKPGGQFATFAYLQGMLVPAGQRFAALLPDYFSEVKRSRVVWRNVPPAFVYRCRR